MATRAPRGSARSRGGQPAAARDEFVNDEPLEVILPNLPPGGARPAGKGGSGRGTGGSRGSGATGRGGTGGGRGSRSGTGTGVGRNARSGGGSAARSGTGRGGRGAGGGGTVRSGKKRASASRGGKRGAARKRTPAPSHDPVVILAKWLYHVLAAGWMVVAGTLGFAVRRIGRGARDLHPDHQRDGAGLFCLGLAIVFAAGVWVRMHNAAGRGIYDLTSSALGDGAFTIPLLLALLGWRFMRHPDRNSETSRAVIGWVALLIGVIGLIHVAKGTPHPSDGVSAIRSAGGYVGYAVSAPLVAALTPWVATPLLGLVACFGLLVITGTPIRHVPARLGELKTVFGFAGPEPEDELVEGAEDGSGPGGRTVRGEIAKAIRLRPPAIEPGERLKPYDTPVLGPGGRRPAGAAGAAARRPRRPRRRPGSAPTCSRNSASPRSRAPLALRSAQARPRMDWRRPLVPTHTTRRRTVPRGPRVARAPRGPAAGRRILGGPRSGQARRAADAHRRRGRQLHAAAPGAAASRLPAKGADQGQRHRRRRAE